MERKEDSQKMWRRGRLLGIGAFGLVSMAISPENNNGLPPLMAVKSAELAISVSIQREKEVLDELASCPHIIRCLGSDTTEEHGLTMYNMFLELAEKGSLRDMLNNLRKKRATLLSDVEVKKIAKSILLGLSYIHKRGFVHCDIKPDNILLTTDNEVKIADFGWAKKLGSGEEKGSEIRGTIIYLAPEGIDGEYGTVFDSWGLGCTVLEMLTGKQPWEGADKVNSWNLVMRISFSEEIPEVPDWLSEMAKDFLAKCFLKDPKLRWTADRLLEHQFINAQ